MTALVFALLGIGCALAATWLGVKCLRTNPHNGPGRPDYALIARLESELGVGVEAGSDPVCPFCERDGEGLPYTEYLHACTGCADRYFRDTGGHFGMWTEGERR